MTDWQGYLERLPGTAVRGGEAYLTIDSALEALGWIEDHGAMLLGVEGFHLTSDATVPSLNHIADVGPQPTSAFPLGVARDLLDRWRHELDAVVLAISTE